MPACKLIALSILFSLISTTLLPASLKAQGAKGAIQLDGINDYADFGNNNRGITDQLTVEAWVRTDSYGHHHILTKYDRDAENGFQLLIQNGKACLAGRDGSGNYRSSGYSSTIVADNNWHHLAGVVVNGTWMIYVDGVLEGKVETGYPNTILSSNEKLLLGNYYYVFLGNHFYKGQVDEVRIWKKALTEEQIRQNMCSTLPANAADLVAYLKLDNLSEGVVVDHSSLKMNGRLVNTTPAVAGVTSGAPIGDKSVYRYPKKWDSSLELVSNEANFSVAGVDPAVQGFHLYTVQSPPASTNGIKSPEKVKEYFGLFKVGAAGQKYKVHFRQAGSVCGGALFRRQDNTAGTWSQVADTVASPLMLYTSSANYGEFAVTPVTASPISISGPGSVCAGSTATLSVTNPDHGQIVWSTGDKTPELTVTKSGTYWAEVTTAGGCTTRDELTVMFEEEPGILLPGEAFVCEREPVQLDATTEGATYSWSNGQVTPSIKISAPGIYTVTITRENCAYVKDIVVSGDECPIIPNIITPNGDGKNDSFVVNGVVGNTLELKIFNRWGKSVYHSDRYDNSWSAAEVPTGVYYYQLTSSRTQKVYKGWLEVIK
ncbi:LamG-like jellyroll fold domain-containing protein [Pontibacter flavimaris]|nr:LamG-like jellyroll fold domain-containing protein [Pontibacter flavimaris]